MEIDLVGKMYYKNCDDLGTRMQKLLLSKDVRDPVSGTIAKELRKPWNTRNTMQNCLKLRKQWS